jgi:hypothetical protein
MSDFLAQALSPDMRTEMNARSNYSPVVSCNAMCGSVVTAWSSSLMTDTVRALFSQDCMAF